MVSRILVSLMMLALWALPTDGGAQTVQRGNEFAPGAAALVFAEGALLREQPADAAPGVTLRLGTPLTIVAKSKTQMRSGYSAPWYRASMSSGRVRAEGFVWAGDLALAEVNLSEPGGGTKVLAGVVRGGPEAEGGRLAVALRAERQGRLLSEVTFIPELTDLNGQPAQFFYSVRAQARGPGGLNGVRSIVDLELFYEACGYNNSHNYFLWTGTKLVGPLVLGYGSEAGIYRYETTARFPDEKGGRPGTIVTEYEAINYAENGEPRSRATKSIIYRWDGSTLKREEGGGPAGE